MPKQPSVVYRGVEVPLCGHCRGPLDRRTRLAPNRVVVHLECYEIYALGHDREVPKVARKKRARRR